MKNFDTEFEWVETIRNVASALYDLDGNHPELQAEIYLSAPTEDLLRVACELEKFLIGQEDAYYAYLEGDE